MNDLSEYSFAVLAFIANGAGGRASAEALNARFGQARVNDLIRKKLIEPAEYAGDPERPFHASAWRLTPAGWDALKAHQDAIEKERQTKAEKAREKEEDRAYATKEKGKDHRHNYLVAVFQALLTFALGLLVEYRFQVVAFFVKLFVK